jgi:tetratricopeptide (TPR) repeat protein
MEPQMKRQSMSTKVIAAVLSVNLIVAPVSATLSAQPEETDEQQLPLYHSPEFSPQHPEAAEQVLRNKQTPLSYEQLLDYAMTQMQQDRFREAVVLYEQALRYAPDDEQRVFSLMWLGQSLLDSASTADPETRPALFKRAGLVFNQASQLSSASPEAAAMRVIAWTNAADQLELSAAEHDLRRLGVELEGDEVFLSVGVILALTFAASVFTYETYVLISDLTQEEKLERLAGVMKISAAAMFFAKPRVPKVISPFKD